MKVYQPSGIQVYTGCTKHPAPGQKFCADHKDYQSPVLLPDQLTKESLENLNRQHKNNSNLEVDMLFIIESILEQKGDSILVKWEGYKHPTWEPFANMPEFVKHFVENSGPGKIPDPVVKHQKTVDGNTYVMLEWRTDTGEKDVVWKKVDKTEESTFKCDTKKDKDKRICRHSFGINIACWPCGVVVMFKVRSIVKCNTFLCLFRSCTGLSLYRRCMHRLQSGWQHYQSRN